MDARLTEKYKNEKAESGSPEPRREKPMAN
jgi:hypothetical protein